MGVGSVVRPFRPPSFPDLYSVSSITPRDMESGITDTVPRTKTETHSSVNSQNLSPYLFDLTSDSSSVLVSEASTDDAIFGLADGRPTSWYLIKVLKRHGIAILPLSLLWTECHSIPNLLNYKHFLSRTVYHNIFTNNLS